MADPPLDNIPKDERDLVTKKLIPATKSSIEYSLRALVGHVISDRVLNVKAIRNIMFKTWEEYKGLYITYMGENKFLFTFPSVKNAEDVLAKSPWFVMNQVLSLQRWKEGLTFTNIDFSRVPFWMQIHGLACEDVNPANAPIILNRVAKVLEVIDPMKASTGSTGYIRDRVEVDAMKPICSGCWLQKPGQTKVWVNFKYERLQGIFHNCGKFAHEQKHCEIPQVMAADNKQLPKYGPFLTVSEPRVFNNLPFGDAFN